jgi:hypothetical protein
MDIFYALVQRLEARHELQNRVWWPPFPDMLNHISLKVSGPVPIYFVSSMFLSATWKKLIGAENWGLLPQC